MRIFTFTLLLLILSNTIYAVVLIDETFDYPVSNLASETSWITEGTIVAGTGRNIVGSALTYSNSGKTYILSGVGKTLNSDITNAADYKSYKPFTTTAVNSGALYISFLYKPGIAQNQTNSEVMGMADGTSQGPRIWVGKGIINTSNYRIGLTRGSTTGSAVIWGTTEYSDVSATMLIVIKYDFSNSTASVFVNPVLSSVFEPTANVIDNSTSTFRTQLNNLWFRCQGSNAARFNIGGIRVATTWAEVMADKNTPKLTTPTIGTATNITGDSFTANWTVVENALGYSVLVYQGTTLVKTSNISGAAVSSLTITGLLVSTTYSYRVIAKGDGNNYSDSNESESSQSFQTLNTGVDFIITNFGHGSWGTPSTTTYSSGNYPSFSANGFNLLSAFLQAASVTCPSGELHTNRILVDKGSAGGAVEFPVLKTIGELEIHAATGTDAMSFRLEEYVNNQWTLLNTYITRKTPDSTYIIPLVRNINTKFRIANNTGSGLYIYKIKSTTLQETLELNLRNTSPLENEVVFSNIKKTITLTFNKNIEKLSGVILLNGVEIPLSSCTIYNNVATVPVNLTTNAGSNKSYAFTVGAGTFGESGNISNVSKAISINFQTIKSVVYPSSYSAQLDVVYKNVNSTNTRMDIYYPSNPSNPVPVVINMHGGGWVSGFKEEQGGFNMYFDRGFAVANVEYRLRGEALAPAAVEDVRCAMHYLLNNAQTLNIDPNKIIFQGGSAGGHLALMGGYLQNNRIYDNDCTQYPNPIKIMAVIDKYGPCDFSQLLTYSSLISWTGNRFTDQVFLNSISPIEYVNTNTPPTYIIHGDLDPTIPYNQSVTLYTALQNAGVKSKFTTVPGGGHGGFSSAYNTQMETEIGVFLNEVMALQTTITEKELISEIKMQISDNNLMIISPESVIVYIYDMTGKEIFRTENKNISLPHKGIFYVKASNRHGEIKRKVMIK